MESINLNNDQIMSLAEAAEKWNQSITTIKRREKDGFFPQGSIRKFGKQWVVTAKGMSEVFGNDLGLELEDINLEDKRIMTSTEALEDSSALRHKTEEFPEGTLRKFGRTWVVTQEGINKVFKNKT